MEVTLNLAGDQHILGWKEDVPFGREEASPQWKREAKRKRDAGDVAILLSDHSGSAPDDLGLWHNKGTGARTLAAQAELPVLSDLRCGQPPRGICGEGKVGVGRRRRNRKKIAINNTFLRLSSCPCRGGGPKSHTASCRPWKGALATDHRSEWIWLVVSGS